MRLPCCLFSELKWITSVGTPFFSVFYSKRIVKLIRFYVIGQAQKPCARWDVGVSVAVMGFCAL